MLRLANANLSITVDPATGVIRSLIDRTINRDYCHPGDSRFEMIGGLRVKEMLTGKVFDDFHTPSEVRVLESSESQAGGKIVLAKRFAGADFVIRLELRLVADSLQWDTYVRKTAGPDRQIRLSYLLPLPGLNLWAPMADPFVQLRWEEPFQIRHGLSYGRAVQPQHRSVLVPLVSFYNDERCLAYSIPPDLQTVLVRFMNSADEDHVFLRNSIVNYPIDQRPHFKVVFDYLSLRGEKERRFSLLISAHQGKWREALGWYAEKYAPYFQPDPKVRQHDGVYAISTPYDRDPDESKAEPRMAGRAERGVKWMELHGHFPWYGLYVSPTEPWQGHHESGELTFEKVRRYIKLAQKYGITVHVYYNIVDGQIPYVTKEFPESIARDEAGKYIPAFHDCYLMNADLDLPFGKHCLEQFSKLLDTYSEADGVFFDVYGRHYDIDFSHDDGITMVNNKPAYCIKFAYMRLMEKILPMLRQRGMVFSANKPEGIEVMRGIDYIMADEGLDSDRVEAMSYYALFKPIIVLDGQIATRAEPVFKTCLRLGMFYNDLDPDRALPQADEAQQRRALAALEAYGPLFKHLPGRTWVLSANALELPDGVEGNIFRQPDGDYIVTLVSRDRSIFDDLPPRTQVCSADYQGARAATIDRDGQTLTITVGQHKTASVLLLKRAKR